MSILPTRLVQTNEVSRCAYLLPAFSLVAEAAGLPLTLVEVGVSIVAVFKQWRWPAVGRTGHDTTPCQSHTEVVIRCSQHINRLSRMYWTS